MKKRQTITTILCISSGMAMAVLTYFYSVSKLLEFEDTRSYCRLDFFNVALLTDDFDRYKYLFREDFMIAFMPMLFLFFGAFLSASVFLLMPKGHLSFIIPRAENTKRVIREARGRFLKNNIFYCTGFMAVLYGLSYAVPHSFDAPSPYHEPVLLLMLLANLLIKIFTVQLLCNIIFIIYHIKNTSTAFLGGICSIVLLILFDIFWESGNVILFNPQNHFIESTAILIVLNIAVYFICFKLLNIEFVE